MRHLELLRAATVLLAHSPTSGAPVVHAYRWARVAVASLVLLGLLAPRATAADGAALEWAGEDTLSLEFAQSGAGFQAPARLVLVNRSSATAPIILSTVVSDGLAAESSIAITPATAEVPPGEAVSIDVTVSVTGTTEPDETRGLHCRDRVPGARRGDRSSHASVHGHECQFQPVGRSGVTRKRLDHR